MRSLVLPFRFVIQYFYGAFQELRNVSWPSRQQIIYYTTLVLVSIAVGVLILTAFDYGMQQLTNRFLLR